MDFLDQLQTLTKHIEKHHCHVATEEATRNAFVLPFLQILGFNIFDPTEVLPGFAVNAGGKNDRIDYAIFLDNKPAMLFECKSCDFDLDNADTERLARCFRSTSATIGVLTNGEKYSFYSDLEEQNIMDDQPFMKIDLCDIDTSTVSEIKKLSKRSFDHLNEGAEGKQKRNKSSFIEHLHNPMITDEEFEGFFVVKVT
jgi:predicted type IV restriction endonuclease